MKHFERNFLLTASLMMAGIGTSSAQGLVNRSALTVQNGATLYVRGDASNAGGGVINNGGEIRISGNFDNTGNSGIDGLVVIDGAGNQSISGSSDFFGVLQVEKTGGSATVVSGETRVHEILRLAEGQMNANGNLVISSTSANGTGLVDDFSNPAYDGTLSGNLRVQRYIPGDAGYHYIGSPVNNASVSELSELGLYGPDGGQVQPTSDCNPNFVQWGSPFGRLFEWHEEGPWLVPGCNQSGWFVRSAGNMTNGRGYAAITSAPGETLEIGGSVGNTSENSVVTYSGLNITNPIGDGWHLLSNPFPSPIIWNTSTWGSLSGIDGGISFYESSGPYAGTYQPFIPVQNKVIGSMQGFMVRVSAGPTSWALPQSFRVLGDPTFYKLDNANSFDIVVQAQSFADKTTVRFGNDGESTQYDVAFDAKKIPAPDAQPTVYTRMGRDNLGINSLDIFDHPMTIPLDLIPGVSGEFKFRAEHLESFTVESHVYLEDLKKGTIQELTVNPVYVFNADESDDPERFLLHFRLNGEEPLLVGEDILMYANGDQAFLFLPEYDGKGMLEVYDALGSLVFQSSQLAEGKNTFDLNHLATGAYVMRAMIEGQDPISRKVILN